MKWEGLSSQEQEDLSSVIGQEAQKHFESRYDEQGRNSLINIYYLLKSPRVAGDLWLQIRSLLWVGCNQIGVEVTDPKAFRSAIENSGNFTHDSFVTLLMKRAEWSLRQTRIDGQPIRHYGLQVYRRNTPSTPNEVVLDIDAVVLAGISSIPGHILDVLRPDPRLNDPLKVREEMIGRGLFPDRARDDTA